MVLNYKSLNSVRKSVKNTIRNKLPKSETVEFFAEINSVLNKDILIVFLRYKMNVKVYLAREIHLSSFFQDGGRNVRNPCNVCNTGIQFKSVTYTCGDNIAFSRSRYCFNRYLLVSLAPLFSEHLYYEISC